MRTARARRTPKVFGAIVVAFAVQMAPIARPPSAFALYTTSPTGSGKSRAATLPVPAAPTITSAGVVLLACVVHLSWTTPPSGEQYTIQRTNGTTTSTVSGPTTTAGTAMDTILVSALLGNPTYTVKAAWAADPLWTVTSAVATASGC